MEGSTKRMSHRQHGVYRAKTKDGSHMIGIVSCKDDGLSHSTVVCPLVKTQSVTFRDLSTLVFGMGGSRDVLPPVQT